MIKSTPQLGCYFNIKRNRMTGMNYPQRVYSWLPVCYTDINSRIDVVVDSIFMRRKNTVFY